MHRSPVHTNSFGRMFIEGVVPKGSMSSDILRSLCLRIVARAVGVAEAAPGGTAFQRMVRERADVVAEAEHHFVVQHTTRAPRRWMHSGVAGCVAIPEHTILRMRKDTRASSEPRRNNSSAGQLLCVFERLETRMPATRIDPQATSTNTLLYARITLCGFVCPQRLVLEQCERRTVMPSVADPGSVALGTGGAAAINHGAPDGEPYTVFLVPRIDIVYNPLAAIGSASALDAHLVPKPKHSVSSESRNNAWSGAATYDTDAYESGPDFDFMPNSADESDYAAPRTASDSEVVVLHSDSTNGTVHDEAGSDATDGGHDTDDAAHPPAATSAASASGDKADSAAARTEATAARTKRRRATTTKPPKTRKKRPTATRTVDVLRQTFGSVRQDTGLRVPPSVETLQRSARSPKYATQWDTSIDTRALLKHLERWLTCIAGAARSRNVVMSRLLQRIDQFQTEEPFLDALAQAVMCTAVCRDPRLATVFMNTYGDLVQCQVSGVVSMDRQRDILWRYKCDVHAPLRDSEDGERPPAWHVRVRNAVVVQVGEVIRDYNAFSNAHGDVVHDSVFRCAVNASREYLQREAYAAREPGAGGMVGSKRAPAGEARPAKRAQPS